MSMPTRGWTSLFSFLALAVCLFGCGGGSSPPASDFTLSTFQAASRVLGQSTFDEGEPNEGGRPSALTLNTPAGLAWGGLWVADSNNNRVLHIPAPLSDGLPDFVAGQPDFLTVDAGLSASTLEGPRGVDEAGGKLFVADFWNNRVLIWNSIPTVFGTPADVVVGQADFVSKAIGLTAGSLYQPTSVRVAAGRLLVCDWAMDRVLIWNTVPTTNGAPADLVLGQVGFTASTSGAAADEMNNPRGVWSDGVRVVVVEQWNNRVLIWNTFPAVNGQPADLVLGQPGFGSSTPGTGASSLLEPNDVASDGVRLAVSDLGNNRVLLWNTFPTTNGQPADVVLGQGDFVHGTANDDDQDGLEDVAPTARTLKYPAGLWIEGTHLHVADSGNHRVLVFGP